MAVFMLAAPDHAYLAIGVHRSFSQSDSINRPTSPPQSEHRPTSTRSPPLTAPVKSVMVTSWRQSPHQTFDSRRFRTSGGMRFQSFAAGKVNFGIDSMVMISSLSATRQNSAMPQKEASARIKINKLLESAGWRFFDDGGGPANISLEPNVKITQQQVDANSISDAQSSTSQPVLGIAHGGGRCGCAPGLPGIHSLLAIPTFAHLEK